MKETSEKQWSGNQEGKNEAGWGGVRGWKCSFIAKNICKRGDEEGATFSCSHQGHDIDSFVVFRGVGSEEN